MKVNKITKHQINYSHYSQTSIHQLPKFTTANKLLVKDKFRIELSNKKNIELTLGDKICIVKPIQIWFVILLL